MPWVRIDDQLPDHPKILTAGPYAELLHIHALTYCSRYLTDGFVPEGALPRLVVWPDGIDNRELAELLITAGLWERTEGGYRIHDYLDYNPSHEEVLAKRQARQEAGRKGGLAKAAARALPTIQQTGGKTVAFANPSPHPLPQETEVVDRAREPVEITEAAASREITAGWAEVAPTTAVPPAIRHRLLKAAADGFEHALLRELAKRCASPRTKRSAPYLDQLIADCERLGNKTLGSFLAAEKQDARAAPADDRPQFLNKFV